MDNKERRQRTLIIVGIIVFFLLTLIAIYFLFFSKTTDEPTVGEPTFGEGSGDREGVVMDRERDRDNQTGVFAPRARLRLISEEPVAGATTIETEEKELVRFLERKTSHVFDTDLDTLENERLSNTTIPRIHEALWTKAGEGVIMRYLHDDNQTIKTYYADLTEKDQELEEGETPFTLSGGFLQDNIEQIVLSPSKENAFWLTGTMRNSRGIISNPDGTNQRVAFTSDFTEWIPQWPNNDTLTMTTKASGVASGFSYHMPSSSGSLNRSVGNMAGLTTLTSPDGKYTLYSRTEEGSFRSYIYNSETEESEQIFIRLLPEKCAWTSSAIAYCGVPDRIPNGLYPDIWYQGRILFTDSIFRIDAENNDARRVYSPVTEDEEMLDIYKPFISESGDYLIFNDKANMSLWAFTLE